MTRDTWQSDVLAEETHSGGLWSLILLLALIGPAFSVALVPSTPARVALAVAGVIGLGAIAMAAAGFQYRFLRDGVEVRTLGFKLRSIPKQAIVSYSIEPWAFIRGYGIRGIGSTRAYVWGNKVVHIKTSTGEVYLGHSDPEKIVHELDRVTGFNLAGAGEPTIDAVTTHSSGTHQATVGARHKSGSWFLVLTCLMWVALPISALEYWDGWDSFPPHMAVHFDSSFRPNGFASRETAVITGLGIMGAMLVLFTVVCLSARAWKPEAAWVALLISYIVVAILWYANHSIVKFNLNAQPAHSELVGSDPWLPVTHTS